MFGQVQYVYVCESARFLDISYKHRKMSSKMRIHKRALDSRQYC